MNLEFGTDDAGGTVWLPAEPSEKCAIVGISGSGKSYLAKKMAEQWFLAGTRFAVLDPVGNWWGLRTSATGDPRFGLPVRIYGGIRGDAPLPDPAMAAWRLALAKDHCCVYDLSTVRLERLHGWAATFLNKLGEMGPWLATPLHLIVEEAATFCQQTGSLSGEQRACRGAMIQTARAHRNFGIGMTVVTQRAAALDKNVLTQCGTLLAMRIAAKHDRRALVDWAASNTTDVDPAKQLDGLASAEPGHGVLWSAHWAAKEMRGARFRTGELLTFHPDPARWEGMRAANLLPMSLEQEPSGFVARVGRWLCASCPQT